ncbi:MAG: hypothetical protein AAB425_10385, partial [Bdellovibrionota bacterium]
DGDPALETHAAAAPTTDAPATPASSTAAGAVDSTSPQTPAKAAGDDFSATRQSWANLAPPEQIKKCRGLLFAGEYQRIIGEIPGVETAVRTRFAFTQGNPFWGLNRKIRDRVYSWLRRKMARAGPAFSMENGVADSAWLFFSHAAGELKAPPGIKPDDWQLRLTEITEQRIPQIHEMVDSLIKVHLGRDEELERLVDDDVTLHFLIPYLKTVREELQKGFIRADEIKDQTWRAAWVLEQKKRAAGGWDLKGTFLAEGRARGGIARRAAWTEADEVAFQEAKTAEIAAAFEHSRFWQRTIWAYGLKDKEGRLILNREIKAPKSVVTSLEGVAPEDPGVAGAALEAGTNAEVSGFGSRWGKFPITIRESHSLDTEIDAFTAQAKALRGEYSPLRQVFQKIKTSRVAFDQSQYFEAQFNAVKAKRELELFRDVLTKKKEAWLDKNPGQTLPPDIAALLTKIEDAIGQAATKKDLKRDARDLEKFAGTSFLAEERFKWFKTKREIIAGARAATGWVSNLYETSPLYKAAKEARDLMSPEEQQGLYAAMPGKVYRAKKRAGAWIAANPILAKSLGFAGIVMTGSTTAGSLYAYITSPEGVAEFARFVGAKKFAMHNCTRIDDEYSRDDCVGQMAIDFYPASEVTHALQYGDRIFRTNDEVAEVNPKLVADLRWLAAERQEYSKIQYAMAALKARIAREFDISDLESDDFLNNEAASGMKDPEWVSYATRRLEHKMVTFGDAQWSKIEKDGKDSGIKPLVETYFRLVRETEDKPERDLILASFRRRRVPDALIQEMQMYYDTRMSARYMAQSERDDDERIVNDLVAVIPDDATFEAKAVEVILARAKARAEA